MLAIDDVACCVPTTVRAKRPRDHADEVLLLLLLVVLVVLLVVLVILVVATSWVVDATKGT